MKKFGYVLKGATKGYADRITRVGAWPNGVARWWIACAAPDCSGEICLRYHKVNGNEFCENCAHTVVFGRHLLHKKLEPYKDRIVAMSQVPRGKYKTNVFWMRCGRESCEAIFRTSDFLTFGFTECAACRKAARTLFGIHVVEDEIWKIKETLVDGWRGQDGVRRWFRKCASKDCASKVEYRRNSKYKGTCLACRSKERRKRPFETNFNCAINNAKAKGWHFALTYEQFVELCAIPFCFYCEKDLGRRAFRTTKDATKTGKFLDRVDANRGYDIENVVPCCAACNSVKGKFRSGIETLLVVALRQGAIERARDVAASSTWRDVYAKWLKKIGGLSEKDR